MISTRLHWLADLIADDAQPFEGHAHYVIDDRLMEMMVRTDVQDSIRALLQVEMAHLPFSPLLVEFGVIPGVRRFVLLEEQGAVIHAKVATLYDDGAATLADSPIAIAISPERLAVTTSCTGNDGDAAALATAIALLLLNTKGIAKDVINPIRLNKARVATGKSPIPMHSVLRIGTVYAADGNPDGMTGKRQVRVHLRAGHVRNQACGKDMADHRLIYIPPVLVNFAVGAEAPQPTTKIITR